MNLTEEAKIYLGTKVVRLEMGKYRNAFFGNDGECILIMNYNPHEIEGARYLRDLVNSLTEEQRDSVADEFEGVEFLDDWKGWIPFALNEFEIICEAILNGTGYKGKVWEG